jgi:hypothetical protein
MALDLRVVSPELALIDPTLAARLRAAPRSPARWEVTIPLTTSVAEESPPPALSRRTSRPLWLAISLAVNVVLLGVVLRAPSRDAPTLVEAQSRPIEASTSTQPRSVPVAEPSTQPARIRSAPPAAPTGLLVRAQERVLAGLAKNPELRAVFVDSSTSLPRNGVVAQCRPATGSALRCTVSRTSATGSVSRTVTLPVRELTAVGP